MSNRISVIRGTSDQHVVDLVDVNMEPFPLGALTEATAEFVVREDASQEASVVRFTTVDNPASLRFKPGKPLIEISLAPEDTVGLAVKTYFHRVRVTLASGAVSDAVPWAPFDVTLGGSTVPSIPPFVNTVKLDADYGGQNMLAYYSPGGSPVQGAQVRVYLKSDYDAGRLEAPVGVTMTSVAGRFMTPILVTPGYSYVIRYEKPHEWGPDTTEIIA